MGWRTMRVNAGPFAPLIGRTADMIEGVTGVKGFRLGCYSGNASCGGMGEGSPVCC